MKGWIECKLQQMNWGPMACSFNSSKTFQKKLININVNKLEYKGPLRYINGT